MYKYHRFEYYNHRNSLIGLIFTTYASILFLIPLNVSGFYLTWCLAGYQEHYDVPASYAFFDYDDENGRGLCQAIVVGFQNVMDSDYNRQELGLIYFFDTLM